MSSALPPGAVVRSSASLFGERVFFVARGLRHWIRDGKWFEQHGIPWPDGVQNVSPDVLLSFRPGGPAPLRWPDHDIADPPASATSLELREMAGSRLQGRGLEVGAGSSPFPVPLECQVLYADRLSHAALDDELYPGQSREELVEPDLVADLDELHGIAEESLDFIVACHVIEHTRNPIGAIARAHACLRPGGTLLLVIPDMTRTFDREREVTPLEHLVGDFEAANRARSARRAAGSAEADELARQARARDLAHYQDFYAHAFKVDPTRFEATVRDRFESAYAIHYHAWTHASFMAMIEWIRGHVAPYRAVWSHGAGPNVETDIEFYCVLTK